MWNLLSNGVNWRDRLGVVHHSGVSICWSNIIIAIDVNILPSGRKWLSIVLSRWEIAMVRSCDPLNQPLSDRPPSDPSDRSSLSTRPFTRLILAVELLEWDMDNRLVLLAVDLSKWAAAQKSNSRFIRLSMMTGKVQPLRAGHDW